MRDSSRFRLITSGNQVSKEILRYVKKRGFDYIFSWTCDRTSGQVHSSVSKLDLPEKVFFGECIHLAYELMANSHD